VFPVFTNLLRCVWKIRQRLLANVLMRTAVNYSAIFCERRLGRYRGDWRDQVKEGAHVLDVCAAYVGRNEVEDMREIISRFTDKSPFR